MQTSSINKIMNSYVSMDNALVNLITYKSIYTALINNFSSNKEALINIMIGSQSEYENRLTNASVTLSNIKVKIEAEAMDTLTDDELTFLGLKRSEVP